MKRIRKLVEKNRQEILALSARHGARNVQVFGSAARGEEWRKSELDLLVDLDPGRNHFDLGHLLVDLEDLLGCRVDVVTTGDLHWYIRERILDEAVPL